ncbi:pyrroloquinoline-quinone synthase PqqC [Tunturiibacter empetritectus]|uniref:Pyrroloquinoline-quinone synthase n=1 Tax=Tunturiibacter lichenicola TaxID=2051959 RepID=A0A852VE92_9BACT|nr:pyrroloquinoline-quinone synthase PqqC [Edaphobacter lichenicola]NYF89857.1 pyrroloquinoline-quinone synthase [Edaphobacter lichenicola]
MGRTRDNAVAQTEPVLLSKTELRQRLQQVGEAMYHHQHPFHIRMHAGQLTRGQMQAWVLNRFYYQSRIPIKDAIILSKSEDVAFRRAWRKRIVDHDGDHDGDGAGGIEKWLQLAEAAGLDRDYVISTQAILPGVRYAVDAYIDLVTHNTLLEAVSSSLTELFAGQLIALRMDALAKHYPWLQNGLAYFQGRLTQAPEDAAFAFDYAAEHAVTPQLQSLVIHSLERKCALLWAQLDALHYCYVEPGSLPPQPNIFRPESS